jgi:hypothetical protein
MVSRHPYWFGECSTKLLIHCRCYSSVPTVINLTFMYLRPEPNKYDDIFYFPSIVPIMLSSLDDNATRCNGEAHQ